MIWDLIKTPYKFKRNTFVPGEFYYNFYYSGKIIFLGWKKEYPFGRRQIKMFYFYNFKSQNIMKVRYHNLSKMSPF